MKGGSADKARHRLEQEEDPAELFRALMKASPDGSVPPHLLDRLRELEGQPRPAAAPKATPANSPQKGSKGQGPRGQGLKAQGPRGQGPKAQAPKAAGRRSGEDLDLYTAFAQLLLEDDEP